MAPAGAEAGALIGVGFRPLRAAETDAAAAVHREGGAVMPGYRLDLHTPEEDRALYRDVVFPAGPIWGAFLDCRLVGHVALAPGWISHLFVLPEFHRRGIGRELVSIAQAEQAELQLWTFQCNQPARALYEAAGFAAEEFTDGAGNEEGEPDVRYRWRES